MPVVQASIFMVVIPTRRPVKLPGPLATANASMASRVHPASRRIESIDLSSLLLWVLPDLIVHSAVRFSSSSSARLPDIVEVSAASILICRVHNLDHTC